MAIQRPVDWCVKHYKSTTFLNDINHILDCNFNSYITDYVMKRIPYNAVELRDLTINDIIECDPDIQCFVLLAHICVIGIRHVPAKNMLHYIQWMLEDPYHYDTPVTIYIWYKSVLNSHNYPTFKLCVNAALAGCEATTLKFLWVSACSCDMILCKTIASIATTIGAPNYLKLIVYTYLCSRCPVQDIIYLFSDVKFFTDRNLYQFELNYTLYHWDIETLEELIRKRYTLYRISKILNDYARYSIVVEFRKFPVYKLHKYLLPRLYSNHELYYIDVPKIPSSYKVPYYLFNAEYTRVMIPREERIVTVHERWFYNLNAAQREAFRKINPVVYQACCDNNFRYIDNELRKIIPLIDNIQSYM